MVDHGSGASGRGDPSAKPVVGAAATPLSPWKTASPSPLSPGSPPEAATAQEDHPPPAIADHELLCCIGRGSYGEVWLARNALGTWRAVKIVYRDNFKDARPYERECAGIRRFEPLSRANEGLVDILQVGRDDAEGYLDYNDGSKAAGLHQ